MYMIPQNRILEKIIPSGRKNNRDNLLNKFSNFFHITKFEENQNNSFLPKISIGILFIIARIDRIP